MAHSMSDTGGASAEKGPCGLDDLMAWRVRDRWLVLEWETSDGSHSVLVTQ